MVAYMEGIKYVNLIEISPVVIEIRGVENGELTVPVNNTLVRHTAFLAADTLPCVLIIDYIMSYKIKNMYFLTIAHYLLLIFIIVMCMIK